MALEDSIRRFTPRGHESLDATGLEKATDAFRRGDFPRAINACLAADSGFTLRTLQFPEGPGWTLVGKESTVFVSVELVTSQLVIEAPIVRLPRTQRVAAMRRALELCDEDQMSSRMCLRGDLLLLRHVAQLAATPPPLVRHIVQEMLAMSERYAELFVAAFDARSATRSDGGLEALGKKKKVGTLQLGASRTSIVPPPPSTLRPDFSAAARGEDVPPVLSMMFADSGRNAAQDDIPAILAPPPMMRETSRSSVPDDIPAILAPPSMLRDRNNVADDIPAILAPPSMHRDRGAPADDMPPILSPSMFEASSSDSMDGMPAVLMPPSSTVVSPGAAAQPEREISPTTARLGGIPAGMMSMPFQASATRQRTAMGLSADGGVRMSTDPETEVSGRRPTPVTPADKLCDLVHRAQALATALSFAERQATMLLLVRATVYRAVYEFAETVPDAVSYLHRMTSSAMRQIWSSKAPPDKNAPMPMAEPSLLAMERVVSLRGQLPKEPKLVVDPLTTAGQARAHLSQYVEEIELAPEDQALRHFLASGALCELLVRARLPTQTFQRIKEYVAYAQTEITKPGLKPEQLPDAYERTITLMMKALKKVISG